MTAGTKLAIGGTVVAGVTAYLAFLGASESWQYYLTADECAAQASALAGSRVRVSGKIVPGSLPSEAGQSEISFTLEGTQGRIHVVHAGQPPDKLTDGMEVVVEGRLGADYVLASDRIFTRCASKYKAQSSSG